MCSFSTSHCAWLAALSHRTLAYYAQRPYANGVRVHSGTRDTVTRSLGIAEEI
jgi:hypothetical protein